MNELLDAFPVEGSDVDRLRARLAAAAEAEGILDVAYRTVDTPVGPLLLAATEQGLVRVAYFLILISHTFLAVIVLPLVIGTLVFAFKSRFEKHRSLARVTLPIWLYVSVTGVIVYWMLYRLHF